MKRILLSLALATILTTSCASYGVRYTESVAWLDYGPLSDKGLYVSPFDAPSDSYELIGDLTLEFCSGYDDSELDKIERSIEELKDDLYSEPIVVKKDNFVKITDWTPHIDYDANSMLDKYGETAINRGADAIFALQYSSHKVGSETQYSISGILAKKRR